MNKVILIGRLVADPEIRYTQGENASCIARYRLAVDRRYRRDGEVQADFIQCVAFGKAGEFAEKYLRKGTKIAVVGRIQTGSYTNNEGNKVYTTDVVVEEHEFCESKSSSSESSGSGQQPAASPYGQTNENEFMNIPEGPEEDLPFC